VGAGLGLVIGFTVAVYQLGRDPFVRSYLKHFIGL
jgi:hypothetical protein